MTNPTDITARTLPLAHIDRAWSAASDAQGGGCGCGGCDASTTGASPIGITTETTIETTGGTTSESAATTVKESDVTTSPSAQSYPVTGMTCGHCVASVTEELEELTGVREVKVDLVAGGTSTVMITSDQPLTDDAVKHAVAEAGYQLA